MWPSTQKFHFYIEDPDLPKRKRKVIKCHFISYFKKFEEGINLKTAYRNAKKINYEQTCFFFKTFLIQMSFTHTFENKSNSFNV